MHDAIPWIATSSSSLQHQLNILDVTRLFQLDGLTQITTVDDWIQDSLGSLAVTIIIPVRPAAAVWTDASDHDTVGDTCNQWTSNTETDFGLNGSPSNLFGSLIPCSTRLSVMCLAAMAAPTPSNDVLPSPSVCSRV
jgi:hypothetical protein